MSWLMGRRRALLGAIAVSAFSMLACGSLQAQDYPSRPVRVVVPFSPGGAVDGPMRVIAQELSKGLGQQVIVDNKPGAGATIGSELVAKAPPDGYMLLLSVRVLTITPWSECAAAWRLRRMLEAAWHPGSARECGRR